MVRAAGFRTAVSTAWGRADRHSPRLELPRMAPQGRSPAEFALRVARGFLERPVWTS